MVQLGVGQSFAEYTLDGLLGQGGMGSVYLARHPRLPRQVALKLLAHEVSGDPELRRRFEQEANAIARLDHPSIVGIHDRGVHDGHLWIAMQYVQGTDASRLDPRQVSVQRALRIITETASALDFAHSRGVLHRDVKPANILLSAADTGREERAILTDFGIARLVDANTQLTSTGTFTATLAYAAPEQLSGEQVDHRADQYSLGCTLFAILAGRPPFASTNPGQVVAGHLSQPMPRLSHIRNDVPPLLDDVIARATAKRREDRFASCIEFATAAVAALSGRAPAPVPSAATVARQQPNPYQPGIQGNSLPPQPAYNVPAKLQPAAIASAALSSVAAFVATAGAIRLYVLYTDLNTQIDRKVPGDFRTTNDFPLTYFGVGTLVASLVALLLFTGAGLTLARKPSGRRMVVTGAAAYALATLLGRTTDNRPFAFFGLAVETAVCVIGLILAIAAAICALSSSPISPGSETSTAPAGSRAVLVATECAAVLGALYAALVTWGFSNHLKYAYYPITTRILMFAAALITLLLIGGVIALMARTSAGRFMVAAGSIGLLLIGLLRKIATFGSLPAPLYDVGIPPYFPEPMATVFTLVLIAFSLAALAGALSKPTSRALSGSK